MMPHSHSETYFGRHSVITNKEQAVFYLAIAGRTLHSMCLLYLRPKIQELDRQASAKAVVSRI